VGLERGRKERNGGLEVRQPGDGREPRGSKQSTQKKECGKEENTADERLSGEKKGRGTYEGKT